MKKILPLGLVVLLFLPLGAEQISATDAQRAAVVWASRGKTFGMKLGRNSDKVSSHITTNGTPFYAVKMSGGTIFMSADTGIAPVIAFTTASNDYATIDRESPLWAILNRDLSLRGRAVRRPKMAAAPGTTASATNSAASKEAKLWADLLKVDSAPVKKFAAPIYMQDGIGDLRVAPLVKSQWSQGYYKINNKEYAFWNYYTPNGPDLLKFEPGNAANAVCGCVATAMSQVMLALHYPTQSVAPVTKTCLFDDSPLNLTTQGGIYEWDKMPLTTWAGDITEEQRQAVGKLTSDAGISVSMMYGLDSSGAFSEDIAPALRSIWGYQSAVFYRIGMSYFMSDEERAQALQKAFFANFDAGFPVCMGVPGHEVVADGYGYNEGFDYVHVNMGWEGMCDYWYNLPDMSEAHYLFTAVDDVVYNIFPTNDLFHAIISGRALSDDGVTPAMAARVQLKSQKDESLYFATASETGVWGAVVPAGTYDISVSSADDMLIGELRSVMVKAPTADMVSASRDVGNCWGNDVVLEPSAPPANDYFAAATELTGSAGTDSLNSVRTTTEAGEPLAKVYSSIGKTVWWKWTAPATGEVTFSTEGSSFDTALGVYVGESLDGLTLVASDDDDGAALAGVCTFRCTGGVAYYIVAGGVKDAGGRLELAWTMDVRHPDNDTFAHAAEIVGVSGQAKGTNVGATLEEGEPLRAHFGYVRKTVWWKWRAPSTGLVTINTTGSSFDTVLGVFTGDSIATLVRVAVNDDAGGKRTSACTFQATAGTVYYIAVGGHNLHKGEILLNWQKDGK